MGLIQMDKGKGSRNMIKFFHLPLELLLWPFAFIPCCCKTGSRDWLEDCLRPPPEASDEVPRANDGLGLDCLLALPNPPCHIQNCETWSDCRVMQLELEELPIPIQTENLPLETLETDATAWEVQPPSPRYFVSLQAAQIWSPNHAIDWKQLWYKWNNDNASCFTNLRDYFDSWAVFSLNFKSLAVGAMPPAKQLGQRRLPDDDRLTLQALSADWTNSKSLL